MNLAQTHEHRHAGVDGGFAGAKRSALVLIHGFTGNEQTWGSVPEFLQQDGALQDYHVLVWKYPAGYNKDAPKWQFGWAQDPSIDTVGKSLRTLLDYALPEGVERIVLAGHSMGGLVIQAFILEELIAGRTKHLSRLAEVIFFGTPSGGLTKARWFAFLSQQVSNMGTNSEFIRALRNNWTEHVDKQRGAQGSLAAFRLTTVAGETDAFVPPQSSLSPFPLDEQLVVPGDHVSMVKPRGKEDLMVRLLRGILLRGTPTLEQRRVVHGESAIAVTWAMRVSAAAELGSREQLLALGKELEGVRDALPRAWRQVGSAMVEMGLFREGAAWLEKYLAFAIGGEKPFEQDRAARQALAIALCGADRVGDAVQMLLAMEPGSDTETQGILAGRLKRSWWQRRSQREIAFRAMRLYQQAFERAAASGDTAQTIYNGINTAYLQFCLGGATASGGAGNAEHRVTAQRVLEECAKMAGDYWALASKAEAQLLLGDVEGAKASYQRALVQAPSRRAWGSTAVQAMDIAKTIGESAAGLLTWLQQETTTDAETLA